MITLVIKGIETRKRLSCCRTTSFLRQQIIVVKKKKEKKKILLKSGKARLFCDVKILYYLFTTIGSFSLVNIHKILRVYLSKSSVAKLFPLYK